MPFIAKFLCSRARVSLSAVHATCQRCANVGSCGSRWTSVLNNLTSNCRPPLSGNRLPPPPMLPTSTLKGVLWESMLNFFPQVRPRTLPFYACGPLSTSVHSTSRTSLLISGPKNHFVRSIAKCPLSPCISHRVA